MNATFSGSQLEWGAAAMALVVPELGYASLYVLHMPLEKLPIVARPQTMPVDGAGSDALDALPVAALRNAQQVRHLGLAGALLGQP